jgi:hypothetical protein
MLHFDVNAPFDPTASCRQTQEARMAEKLSKAGSSKAVTGRMPTKTDLDKFGSRCGSLMEKAKEAQGEVGSTTREFADKFQIEAKSVTLWRWFRNADRSKSALVWDQLNMMMDTSGLSDTDDLIKHAASDDGAVDHDFDEVGEGAPQNGDEPPNPDAQAAEKNAAAIKKGIKADKAAAAAEKAKTRQSPMH